MPDICLYFQLHQPDRLLSCSAMRAGNMNATHDELMNAGMLGQVAEKCYLPANRMFRQLIRKHRGRFRIAMSISGTLIDQMERCRPDVLESFQQLVASGGVELVAETYHHSLAFLHSNKEFDRQVDCHLERLEQVFHVRPRVFRNTGLAYNDALAANAEKMGFDGILAEGVDRNLRGHTPNHLYRAPETARIKTLLRNARLSDDLALRFSDRSWANHPLTPDEFASWLADSPGDVVNLFLPYESIGAFHEDAYEVFRFWEVLPDAVDYAGLQWVAPSEAVELYRASREYACPTLTSWMGADQDMTPWIGNTMQHEAFAKLAEMEKEVLATGDAELLDAWARLLSSNHFLWMSAKGCADGGNVREMYPYADPADARDRFMSAMEKLHARVRQWTASARHPAA